MLHVLCTRRLLHLTFMWTSHHIQRLQNVTSDKDHEELFKEASNSSAYLSLDSRVLARFVTVDYEEHEQFKFGY